MQIAESRNLLSGNRRNVCKNTFAATVIGLGARFHVSQIIIQILNELEIKVLPCPLYSPDPSFTGSVTSRTFSPKELPQIRSRQNMVSSILLNPEHLIFSLIELIHLNYVDRILWITWRNDVLKFTPQNFHSCLYSLDLEYTFFCKCWICRTCVLYAELQILRALNCIRDS